MSEVKRVKVRFEQDDTEVLVPVGTSIMELSAFVGADISFGCGLGHCGTCRIIISEGYDDQNEIDSEEKRFLKAIDKEGNQRLSCKVFIMSDCVIEYIGY